MNILSQIKHRTTRRKRKKIDGATKRKSLLSFMINLPIAFWMIAKHYLANRVVPSNQAAQYRHDHLCRQVVPVLEKSLIFALLFCYQIILCFFSPTPVHKICGLSNQNKLNNLENVWKSTHIKLPDIQAIQADLFVWWRNNLRKKSYNKISHKIYDSNNNTFIFIMIVLSWFFFYSFRCIKYLNRLSNTSAIDESSCL